MDYELFKAVDGKQVDLGKYVTQNILNEILQTERNGKEALSINKGSNWLLFIAYEYMERYTK